VTNEKFAFLKYAAQNCISCGAFPR